MQVLGFEAKKLARSYPQFMLNGNEFQKKGGAWTGKL